MADSSLTLLLFGSMQALVHGKPIRPLRTFKGYWLLSLLALKGGSLERSWLASTLWPNSIEMKALYNLRRCVHDLRGALGDAGARIESPTSRTLRLITDGAEIDVRLFDRCIADGHTTGNIASFESAVELYRGPLLEGCDESWALAERAIRQEMFLNALETLAAAASDFRTASGYLQRAALTEPSRESVHRALMVLLADAGDLAAMTDVYRKLRLHLRDQLNTEPARETRILFQQLTERLARADSSAPPPEAKSLSPSAPIEKLHARLDGALPWESPYYIERDADQKMTEALGRGDAIILVKGPRQIGKTSLIARWAADIQGPDCRVALTDLSTIGRDALYSTNTCLFALARALAHALQIETPSWPAGETPQHNLQRFLTHNALKSSPSRLVWMLDEVDTLFELPFPSEVFALFRAWYNARSLDSVWERLTLVFSYATEAHLFITDLNQSPFNVGTRIKLDDFTQTQTQELARRYHLALDNDSMQRLLRLIGGHPYLTQQALYALGNQEATLPMLETAAARDDETPFSNHLRRLALNLQRDQELRRALARFVGASSQRPRFGASRPDPRGATLDPDMFYRLRSAGLLVGDSAEAARFRCSLYQRYLERRLADGIDAVS